MNEKVVAEIKKIIDDYEKGIFDNKEFVFFSLTDQNLANNLPKTIDTTTAKNLCFASSPFEECLPAKNIALAANKEKTLIPSSYQCSIVPYNALKNTDWNTGATVFVACTIFIKNSEKTLLAKLLTACIFSAKISPHVTAKRAFQTAFELMIPEYSYLYEEEMNTSSSSSSSYTSVFSEEPPVKLKEISDLLFEQEEAKQKLTENHQKQLTALEEERKKQLEEFQLKLEAEYSKKREELLAKQTKEIEELDVKQGEEFKCFLASEQQGVKNTPGFSLSQE